MANACSVLVIRVYEKKKPETWQGLDEQSVQKRIKSEKYNQIIIKKRDSEQQMGDISVPTFVEIRHA